MNPRTLLRSFAVLFAVLAVSNVTKIFEFEPEHGLVFLGKRQSGTPNPDNSVRRGKAHNHSGTESRPAKDRSSR